MQDSRPGTSVPKEKILHIIEDLGYECAGIFFLKEHGKAILRVYIDSLGGIVVKDCEIVSRKINIMLEELDEEDPERSLKNYFLEVSSPGVERPLFRPQDYSRFLGKKIELLVEGKKVRGVLVRSSEDGAEVLPDEEPEEEPLFIPFEKIDHAHLVFDFEVKQHGHKRKAQKKKKRKR